MAPPDLSKLTWTTRVAVASQLARYLRATDPPPDLATIPESSPRVRAGVLLGILAGLAQRDACAPLPSTRARRLRFANMHCRP